MGLASLLGRPQSGRASDSAHKQPSPASHKRKQQPVNEYAVKLASTKRLRVTKPKAAVPATQQRRQQQQKQQQRVQEQQQEDEDRDEEPVAADQSAYEALMGAFAAQKGDYAHALRQRRQEAEGYSDEEPSGTDTEEEADDEGELSEPSTSEHSSGELGIGVQPDGHDEQDQQNGKEGQQQEQASEDDASDDEHGSEDADEQKAVTHTANGHATASAATNGAAAVQRDTWQSHFGRMLSEAEVSALQQGHSASQFVDADTPGTASASAPAASSAGPSSSTRAAAQAVPSATAAGTADAGSGVGRVGTWKQGRWQLCGCSAPEAPDTLSEYGVKERLRSRWADVHEDDASRTASGAQASTSKHSTGDFVSSQQRDLFALCNSYSDILLASKPYPTAASGAEDPLVDAVLLHVLNHVAKCGDRVKKNNERLRAGEQHGGAEAAPRDQGFTRPKVLLLLPMRNFAFNVVRRLVALAQRETRADSVQGKEKFVEQFTDPEADAEEAAAARKGKKPSVKPLEHRALFGGNTDDHFRLGIKITRGAVRLFADLFQADIIVASPIALATKLAEASARDGADSDFLSSIEVLVMERADVMLMQNWQHVVTVLESLNRLPKQQHGGDIMRVHEWALAGLGRFYRQNIITTSFTTPDINAAFARLCASHAGAARLVPEPGGVLSLVVPQARQLFERFSVAGGPSAVSDARFAFFKAHTWPRIREAASPGLLLFCPSYFDFVRLRNFLNEEGADFEALCEYTVLADATRRRALFAQQRVRLLLYTERAHFYHRYRIRGIKDVLFYGLPEHAHFYSELLNLMEDAPSSGAGGHYATVGVLFCKYDALALGRVVGAARAKKMLTSASPSFVFC